MNTYRFTWCVMSFDQECIIRASDDVNARKIFKREVIGDNTTWAANHAYVSNLNDTYTQKYIDQHFTINYSE